VFPHHSHRYFEETTENCYDNRVSRPDLEMSALRYFNVSANLLSSSGLRCTFPFTSQKHLITPSCAVDVQCVTRTFTARSADVVFSV
jgi:hypothetical protein